VHRRIDGGSVGKGEIEMAQVVVQKLIRNGWQQDEEPQLMDEALLVKTEGELDDENEHTVWQEWRLDGKIVKRGAHVQLKKNVIAEGIAQMLS
jgi:hypothetical protein